MDRLPSLARELWLSRTESSRPRYRHYSAHEQHTHELEFDRFLATLEGELRSVPRTRAQRRDVHIRLTGAVASVARATMDLGDAHLVFLLDGGLSAVGNQLGRRARRAGLNVSAADIFQATRNAWTACGLQALFGVPMTLTPSVYAYSMLYPVTDNYLDDPSVTNDAKRAFNRRFAERLSGIDVEAQGAHEATIWSLVALIEAEHPRALRPNVYAALLAIQRSQIESLRLIGAGDARSADDVLNVTIAKGGTSVEADAHLVHAELSDAQRRFVYLWGVLLQLADDLQDLQRDRRDGARTLFTIAAPPLDALAERTLAFAEVVFDSLHALPANGAEPLKELIERSAIALIVRSVGVANGAFSADYSMRMERYSPCRYAFLADRRARLAAHAPLVVRLFDAFLDGDEDEPAFPVLPSSMLMK